MVLLQGVLLGTETVSSGCADGAEKFWASLSPRLMMIICMQTQATVLTVLLHHQCMMVPFVWVWEFVPATWQQVCNARQA